MLQNVLRYVLVFAIIMGLIHTAPDNMLVRYDLFSDPLIKTGIAVLLTALVAFQSVGFVIVMLLLVFGANMPVEMAAEYNINRDYMLGTLIAVVLMPIARRIIQM